jgi:hypothetical protein
MKDLRICILHRGWVLVGYYSRENNYCKLKNPYVIRRWGTNQGLGEIAINGPQTDTILDKETETEFHETQIIRTILCDTTKWLNYYAN